jgi:predicted dehydrogenase
MNDVRILILGTGAIARKVAPHIAASPGCTLVGAASRERTRARSLCDDLGLPLALTNDELLSGSTQAAEYDAVYITTPNRQHVAQTLALVQRGVHVVCEKPLCWRREQAEALFAAAEKSGAVLIEGFMYLHHPQTAELARIARDDHGPIGRLEHVEVRFETDMRASGRENTRYSHALAGGTLMDIGCYPISFIRSMTRQNIATDPSRVRLIESRIAPALAGESLGIDEVVVAEGKTEDGVTFRFSARMDGAGEKLVRLEGDRGTASTDWPWAPDAERAVINLERTALHPRGPGHEEFIIERGGITFVNQFATFAAAVRGFCPPHPSPQWSIEQAAALEAMLAHVGVDFGD